MTEPPDEPPAPPPPPPASASPRNGGAPVVTNAAAHAAPAPAGPQTNAAASLFRSTSILGVMHGGHSRLNLGPSVAVEAGGVEPSRTPAAHGHGTRGAARTRGRDGSDEPETSPSPDESSLRCVPSSTEMHEAVAIAHGNSTTALEVASEAASFPV